MVGTRIASGRLAPRERLPASRQLAAGLGISRGTVVTAYEQLAAEGYIESRPGSGFYVGDIATDGLALSADSSAHGGSEPIVDPVSAPLTHPGYPDSRLFPARRWARSLARSARLEPQTMLAGQSRFGDLRLRAAIARYLADWRGLEVDPGRILITAGSVDALEICLRTLTTAGDKVALENPCYQPLRHIAENLGMTIDWLPIENGATSLPASRQPPNLVILTPSHQFPLGGAMPIQRRLEFLQWAQARNAWIVEDDYDSEFRYAGRPIPALASLDNADRTIYIGTFSKVFSVSLRLGYLIMPPPQVGDFEATLARFGVKAALPCQPALAGFIDDGDFYRHVRRVRRIYGERRRLLIDLLQQRLSDFLEFEDHQAGMQITTRLAAGFDDREISSACRAEGAIFPPLSEYYGDSSGNQGLLLGFCPYTEDEIRTHIAVLERVLSRSC